MLRRAPLSERLRHDWTCGRLRVLQADASGYETRQATALPERAGLCSRLSESDKDGARLLAAVAAIGPIEGTEEAT